MVSDSDRCSDGSVGFCGGSSGYYGGGESGGRGSSAILVASVVASCR